MKLFATIRQTENGKYFCWESGTAVLKNFKGKRIRRKVFVFFDKNCKKPLSVPVKISVIDGFRSFYQWTTDEGKTVSVSTLVVQNYEIVETGDLRTKELKGTASGITDKELFTNADGIVPF